MKSSTSDLNKSATSAHKHVPAKKADTHTVVKRKKTQNNGTRLAAAALLAGVSMVMLGLFVWLYGGISQQGMVVSSDQQSVAVGKQFIVHVYADSGRKNVNAVQADVTYPDGILQLRAINTTKSAYPIKAFQQSLDGSAQMARGVVGGVTGKQLVADLVFVGIRTGSARISFNKSSTVLLASSTNQDILKDNNFNNINISIK